MKMVQKQRRALIRSIDDAMARRNQAETAIDRSFWEMAANTYAKQLFSLDYLLNLPSD